MHLALPAVQQSIRSIAASLGSAPFTVSSEIQRNEGQEGLPRGLALGTGRGVLSAVIRSAADWIITKEFMEALKLSACGSWITLAVPAGEPESMAGEGSCEPSFKRASLPFSCSEIRRLCTERRTRTYCSARRKYLTVHVRSARVAC